MSTPKIKLQRNPANYQDWPWKDSRLETGMEITELDKLDNLSKTIAYKLLTLALERQEACILWGQHELHILDHAVIWLNARPSEAKKDWSPEVTIHHQNNSWWITQVKRNWKIKLSDLSYQWNDSEERWLSAWSFKGIGESLPDVWGELMHKGTNSYRENDLQDYPRSELNPDFYSYFGREIELPQLSKTVEYKKFDEVLNNRTSKILSPKNLTLQNLSDLLALSFKPLEQTPFKASYSAAGGIYETHIFIEARNIQGLEQGFYAYHPLKHKLHYMGQSRGSSGSATILLISDISQLLEKYRHLSYRLALMNTGVIYHHIGLIISALNLQGHAWGATSEPEWKRWLGKNWKDHWKILGSYEVEGQNE